MPRISQKRSTYLNDDLRVALRIGGIKKGLTSLHQIADAAGIPYTTLLNRCQNPNALTINEIILLSKVIDISGIIEIIKKEK